MKRFRDNDTSLVFSTGQTVLDDLNALFLRGVSSLLHVASAS